MERNKSEFWYSPYSGKGELLVDGKRTGQYSVKYGSPVKVTAVISPARGSASDELFGINAEYDRTITSDDVNIGIDESSVLWIDTVPNMSATGEIETPWDHVVTGVARSLNFVTIAVKRVAVKR